MRTITFVIHVFLQDTIFFFTVRYLLEVLFQNVKHTLDFLFLLFALDFPLKKKSLLNVIHSLISNISMETE